MNKLILFGVMLACGGAANAQNSDQCSPEDSPVIDRIDLATVDRPSANSAVLQVDVAASLDGRTLHYSFHASDGSIHGDGSRATWNVEGDGPFEATIEVSSPGYPCVSHASVTFRPEEQAEIPSE